MASLSIRNLTVSPIDLIGVERFESKKEQVGNLVSNVTGTINGFFNATQHQKHRTVVGEARHKEDVHVRVDAFKSTQTDIRMTDPVREVVRLVFKSENHKYEVDLPSPNSKSSTMKKLDGGDQELTAVYISTGAFVAIFSSTNLNCWMRELHDDYPLPVLSIPGTHNSPTCYKALPSVRCQAVGITEQLQNGVRFLDVRCSAEPNNETLSLVHGAFPITLTGNKYFGTMCDEIYYFLEKNPTETIIMSLKREGTGKGSDQQMSKYLKNHYVDKRPDRWWTDPRVPTLGQARGRIVALRRLFLDDELRKCHEGRGWAIDAQTWPDNCEDGTVEGGHIHVQDFYEITESKNLEKKIDFSCGQLERAAEQHFQLDTYQGPHPPFFMNFLTASNFFSASCWPERIAAKVNPAIIEYLCIRHGEEGKGPRKLKIGSAGTGIVVTDWVGANGDWDLIRCIVGMNARLQFKR